MPAPEHPSLRARLARWIERRLAARVAGRPPDLIIGESEAPYMLRWHLIRTRFGGVNLHLFLRDDDGRALHDHPWHSASLILSGHYHEVFAPEGTDKADPGQQDGRFLHGGDLVIRKAEFAHRIEVLKPGYTLFAFGPVRRGWGFWCRKGFVPWRSFVRPDRPGEIGPGCGD